MDLAHLLNRRELMKIAGIIPVTMTLKDFGVLSAQEVPMAQSNWRWCNKCQGLSFAGNTTQGRCPAGGVHNHAGSGNYNLNDGVGGPLQSDWRWCNKCQGLSFAGNSTQGRCPAGGLHSHEGSGNYYLNLGAPVGNQQINWRWCNRCQGLFFAGNFTTGTCPLGGGHNFRGSGDYSLSSI